MVLLGPEAPNGVKGPPEQAARRTPARALTRCRPREANGGKCVRRETQCTNPPRRSQSADRAGNVNDEVGRLACVHLDLAGSRQPDDLPVGNRFTSAWKVD